jgi:hypothetical protein
VPAVIQRRTVRTCTTSNLRSSRLPRTPDVPARQAKLIPVHSRRAGLCGDHDLTRRDLIGPKFFADRPRIPKSHRAPIADLGRGPLPRLAHA